MKIYTKTGDEGMTGLFAGPRVSKDSARIRAYGEVDELNAVLGVARATVLPAELDVILAGVQHALFSIGAELATPHPEVNHMKWDGSESIEKLESAIDGLEGTLTPLKNFILPGGTSQAASLHLARTTCRRAEREIVGLMREPAVSDLSEIVVYLNRLSDLLFVMARAANARLGVADVLWHSEHRGE